MENDIVEIVTKHYSQILSELDDLNYDYLDVDSIELKIEITENSFRGFHFRMGWLGG